MSAGVQLAELMFNKLLAQGKVSESERGSFYLGFAAGIGWANEQIDRRFVTIKQLENWA